MIFTGFLGAVVIGDGRSVGFVSAVASFGADLR